MFDSVEVAVQAYREAAAAHRRARGVADHAGMDAAVRRITEVTAYLRGCQRPELIQPLTMEWVTMGRDPAEHARNRAEVEKLLRS